MARYLRTIFILLIALSLQQSCTANPFLTAKKAFDFAVGLYKAVDKVQKFVDDDDGPTKSETKIFKQLEGLSTDFQDLRDTVLDKISNQLRDKLTAKTDELFKHIKDIQRLYKTFLEFFKDADKYQSTELKDFADVSTTFSLVELKTTIEKMHETLVDLDVKKESIVSIIAKESTAGDTMCIRGESSQQLIHKLYETVVLSDSKGLMVTLYSYGLKEMFENRTYEFTKNKQLDNYFNRTKTTFNKVKEAMSEASREIWKCDPKKHQKDVSYIKVQEIFQGFVMYEPDTTLSATHATLYTCAALKDERLRCRSAPCKAQPAQRRCKGHLRDCQHVAHTMQLCHASDYSDRRYDWMKTGEGEIYGRDSPCERTQGLWDIWPYAITHCFCNCESEQRDADRYFSVLDATSNVDENKVITGVKLVRREHVFHIQIQQGTLGAKGTIIDEPKWKNVTVITPQQLLSDNISTYHYEVKSYPHENDERELKYEEWVEFYKNDFVYTINYKQNTVYLDDLVAGPNEVLTGLRFQHVGNDLRLEIQTTPFDYGTGKMKSDASSWLAHSNTDKQRQEIDLSEADDPAQWSVSDTYSKNNQLVRFQHTNLKRDFGQYTIPFLDIQDVVSNPPLPLSGAGLYHKKKSHSGGYLGLKLFHYDFTSHM